MTKVATIVKGVVRHRRYSPHKHMIKQRQTMLLLDLDQLPSSGFDKRGWKRWLLAGLWMRRQDYMRPHSTSLATAVRESIKAKGYVVPRGKILFLGHLRQWGLCFNPVCFYFCYDENGQLHTIVSEITNTPWDETHQYILPVVDAAIDVVGNGNNGQADEPKSDKPGAGKPYLSASDQAKKILRLRFDFEKHFHVSPFIEMDVNYHWCFTFSQKHIVIYMRLERDSNVIFDASLNLQYLQSQKPHGLAWQHLFQCQRVLLGIYWHALRLYLKGVTALPHPIRSKNKP